MLVRRNFFPAPAPAFDQSLDRLFRNVFDESGSCESGSCASEDRDRGFAVNVWERDDSYQVDAELPGLDEKNVEVTVLGKELRIEATPETEKDAKEDRGKALRQEFQSGRSSRTLRFPLELESDDVKARFENGVLHVTLPKVQAALPRRIKIQL